MTVEDFKDGRDDERRGVRRIKFRLHDKRIALVDIGKHLGMFSEKVNHIHQVPDGGPVKTINQDMTEKEAADKYACTLLGND